MTPEQLITIGNHIRSNGAVADDLANGSLGAIAAWYNKDASPAVPAWVPEVSTDTANDAIDWSEYLAVPDAGGDNLAGIRSTMKQNTEYQRANFAFSQLMHNGSFDPSLQKTRDALAQIFSGDPNSKAALLAIAKESANNVETLFASAPVQGAVVREFIGTIDFHVVDEALEATQ